MDKQSLKAQLTELFHKGAFQQAAHLLVELGSGALQLVDESYWNLRGDPSRVEVLATGDEEGEARPLVWTRRQGKGRVFCSIPGHYT